MMPSVPLSAVPTVVSEQLRDDGHRKEAWEQGESHLRYEEVLALECLFVCLFAETRSYYLTLASLELTL